MPKTFTCGECHETFEKEWADDEANKQAEDLFGVTDASDHPGMAVVCSDCYREMGFTP